MKSIIPRDELFFEKFEKVADLIVDGVTELKALLDSGAPCDSKTRRCKTIEHECDEVVHGILEHLHKTFVTPFDRQDIRKLFIRMDDILDLSEAAASRIELYQPKQFYPDAKELAEVLLKSVTQVREMIGLLRNIKKHSARIEQLSVEINRLENEADHIRRNALARMFREEKEVIELIKWKDILEHIEAATDRCEDVADIVEAIVQELT